MRKIGYIHQQYITCYNSHLNVCIIEMVTMVTKEYTVPLWTSITHISDLSSKYVTISALRYDWNSTIDVFSVKEVLRDVKLS